MWSLPWVRALDNTSLTFIDRKLSLLLITVILI